MVTFHARRDGDDWLLVCEDAASVHTSVRRLTDAHAAARRALAEQGRDVGDDDVVITTTLPPRAEGHLAAARDLDEQLRDLAARVDDELAQGVQLLRDDGLTQREISVALGLPVRRVRQLLEHDVEKDVPLTARAMEVLYSTGALRRP